MEDHSENSSCLDMQIRPPCDVQVSSEGDASDIIATGIALALVFGGIGVSMAISKTRAWLDNADPG